MIVPCKLTDSASSFPLRSTTAGFINKPATGQGDDVLFHRQDTPSSSISPLSPSLTADDFPGCVICFCAMCFFQFSVVNVCSGKYSTSDLQFVLWTSISDAYISSGLLTWRGLTAHMNTDARGLLPFDVASEVRPPPLPSQRVWRLHPGQTWCNSVEKPKF